MAWTVKRYEGRCPVCHAKTYADAIFLSVGLGIKDDENPNMYYPSLPCPQKHMANEVRKIIGLPPLEKDRVLWGFGLLENAPPIPIEHSEDWGKTDKNGNVTSQEKTTLP